MELRTLHGLHQCAPPPLQLHLQSHDRAFRDDRIRIERSAPAGRRCIRDSATYSEAESCESNPSTSHRFHSPTGFRFRPMVFFLSLVHVVLSPLSSYRSSSLSFIHLFIPSIHSFVHPFFHSFIHLSIHSFIRFILSFGSFIHPFDSFIHLPVSR